MGYKGFFRCKECGRGNGRHRLNCSNALDLSGKPIKQICKKKRK